MKEEIITVSLKQLEDFRDNMNRNFNKLLKPMPFLIEENWKIVVDGGFAIKLKDDLINYRFYIADESILKCATSHLYEVVRQVGIRQPHFKGHPHPEGDTKVWTVGVSGQGFFFTDCDLITWDNVVEYIVLEESSR